MRRRRASGPPAGGGACSPFCGERPVCAVLRPEGEGGKRPLEHSLCFTEWELHRVRCPACETENEDRLPVYSAGEFPHLRVEARDACNT